MFKKFIERPVLSTVISIIIVILGILGMLTLPVAQYPEIAPPTVMVSANYQGANAETVLNSVIIPLEEQINGVEGMSYMTSTATNDGRGSITIYFKLGTDPDLAAVNVQNRVSSASSQLPREVTQAGVSTRKRQTSNVLIFSIYSENPAYDQTFIQNYSEINIVPSIKRVNGVGDATAFGTKEYAIRIWLNPAQMAAYQLMPADIGTVLSEQNIEAAPGQVGERGEQSFEYPLRYKGRLKTVEEFENIIIKATEDGRMLTLKDVAKVELGAMNYTGNSTLNGLPSVGIAVNQTAGSNAQEVIEGTLAVLEQASKSFPAGLKYTTMINANEFLSASISKVITTLIEAFILVFIVVFIFLQDWRSTLIPAIAVPVAIIGTFFFLNLFGFTINLLTLFALVLAVGIVVDDAIVVVEAVHAKLDSGAKSAKKASVRAMDEIGGAIVSITLVMSAVFIPVSFISGSAGVFYKQFGLTLAIAIVISAINALTLSPALCAIFLKPHPKHGDENILLVEKKDGTFGRKKNNLLNRFFIAFDTAFTAGANKYKRIIAFLMGRKWITFAAIVLFSILMAVLMKTSQKAFVPNEDMGTIMADISLPLGASEERTRVVLSEVEKIVQTIPEVQSVLKNSGRGMISGTGSNYGMLIIKLKPWNERKQNGQDVQSIISSLFAKSSGIKDGKVVFFAPPTIQGFGMSGGFQMQLQDKSGGSIQDMDKVARDFLAELNKRPEIQYATTSFNPNFPQYRIDIDVPKAKAAGYSVNAILSAIQGYYGGFYASNVNLFGKMYRVMYQASPEYRNNIGSLNQVYVRNDRGSMAPLSTFISMERVYGPQTIERFNLFTAVSITGAPEKGYSSGNAITAVQETAQRFLPTGYGYEFSGMTREEQSAGSQTVFIFLLCLVFVYFLLAAQYESYILPMAVLLSLPIGLAGVYIFTGIFGVTDNIYVQISLIMLIGLLAKNAILIVEYGIQRRRSGMSLAQSGVSAALARLRPILMTSFALIFGLIPLALSQGAGAVGNRSIGIGAIGGMFIGTMIGVFVIPILFVVFQGIQEHFSGVPVVKRKRKDLDDEMHQPSL